MTLKEQFETVEIMFEGQTGILKYDEMCEASNKCVKIADKHAIDFLEWCIIDNKISYNKNEKYNYKI